MFDWNEEELTDIIWDESGVSDDHIVPYRVASEVYHNKKECSQEAKTFKFNGQNTQDIEVDLHGKGLESTFNYKTNEEISFSGSDMGSLPDLSLSNAGKTDQDSTGQTAELGKNSEIFQSSQESKEQGDFVDDTWANIGSFVDLDRIFSNDEPIFSNVSLGTDEIWPSSKDVSNYPSSFAVSLDSASIGLGGSSISAPLDIKSDYEQQDDHLFTTDSMKGIHKSSHGPQNAHVTRNHAEYVGGRNSSTLKKQTNQATGGEVTDLHSSIAKVVGTPELHKACGKKRLLKFHNKREETSKIRLLQKNYHTWTPSGSPYGHFQNQSASFNVHSPSLFLNQNRQLQESETLNYQQISNRFMDTSSYGNLSNPYAAVPVLSSIQSEEHNNQLLHSFYEISPRTTSINTSTETRSLTMTPQEKIEKLRRRQQMQAMLAIQRQLQQFNQQVPVTDHSMAQKLPEETQNQRIVGADHEDSTTLPCYDLDSPVQQDDCNTMSAAVDGYSTQESILYQLQDVVSKLDANVRLRIRDSLFRLAQSATQRSSTCDTGSSNKTNNDDEHEAASGEDAKSSNGRCAMVTDIETETNPIDRTMAHLLFHRHADSAGTHFETQESPLPGKLPPSNHKPVCSRTATPMSYTPEISKLMHGFPLQGSKSSSHSANREHIDQYMNIPHSTSNYEAQKLELQSMNFLNEDSSESRIL